MTTGGSKTNSSAETLARIRLHLKTSAEVKLLVGAECAEQIAAAAQLIAEEFRTGHKLLLCGNGGSAADCQHMAAEFVSRLTKDFERAALPAIALTTDSSFLTAFANDVNFDGVFARQVEALGQAGDVLLGISTSGGSKNVLRAMDTARARGMKTIALCGRGGKMPQESDVAICVPDASTQFIQESHLAIEHIICDLVEVFLYGKS